MRKFLMLLCLIFNGFAQLFAVNHWIVTQTGKIQAYLESPFDLRRPHDLLALLDQENRRNDINDLHEDLIKRKISIESKWVDIEKNSDIGVKVTSEDVDCLAADKFFSELDLYNNIATNGSERGVQISIPKKINSDKKSNDKEQLVPLCINFTNIKKSESLVNKTNIAIKPEEALRKTFLPVKSLDHFGNYLVSSLQKNSTSWVHYNLASFYWRIKGEGDKAIDCLKLAIQFVTGNFQDIPLHNLAGILHQSHHSKEATQILNSAIQLAPKQNIHYFAMGNIYASMRDFNKSVMFYDKLLELQPSNKDAANNRHAVLCYYKLEKALTSFQSDLQSILTALHDYHSIQQQWLRLQERLMWEHASFDLHYDTAPEMLQAPKKIQRCIKKTIGDKPIISCDFYEKSPDVGTLNLQNLYQIVENEKHKLHASNNNFNLNKQEGKKDSKEKGFDMVYAKFPTTMSTKGNQYFDVTGWPEKEECTQWNLPLEEKDNFNLPVFLPPENKGYQLKQALSEYLGLSEGAQHDLPWYPPVCEGQNVNGEKFIPAAEKYVLDIEMKGDEYLKAELLRYVNNGKADEHEIGQRIISAMNKKTSPKWVLATLAGLYWRVRGNLRKTLDCLEMAFQRAPKDQTDVVLVSLSSVMNQMGFKDQALKYATLAFKINYVEPSTNFLLALLHYESSNPLLAMYYMKNALRVEPGYYDGLAEKLLKVWACRIKLGSGPKMAKSSPDSKISSCSNRRSFKEGSGFGELPDSEKINFHCPDKEQQHTVDPPITDNDQQICGGKYQPMTFGQQIISSLMAAENSDVLTELSRLEKIKASQSGFRYHQIHHRVQVGLSLGAEHPLREYSKMADFFVSLDINENPDNEQRLNVYDKYGTYTLSPKVCQYANLLAPFQYTQLWEFMKDNIIDISPFVKYPIDKNPKDFKPYCMQVLNPSMPSGLNELTLKVLGVKILNGPDKELTDLLQLISGNQKSTVRELGIKIAKALSEDETNWELLTASAIYWMTYGNTEQAVVCLRGAITKVPNSHLDIPLSFLSNLLQNLGLHKDALDIANLALNINSEAVWNHYMVAEIYIKVNGYDQAIPFLRSSLQLNDKFDPARIRLKAVLCKLLFEDRPNQGLIKAKIVEDYFKN